VKLPTLVKKLYEEDAKGNLHIDPALTLKELQEIFQ